MLKISAIIFILSFTIFKVLERVILSSEKERKSVLKEEVTKLNTIYTIAGLIGLISGVITIIGIICKIL